MMKALPFLALPLLTACAAAPAEAPGRPLHTFSIVARDPATGELGVAVQSHWFSVGALVPWAEAGVGAVATQSFVNPAFGPDGLALMRAGKGASEALAELVAMDPGEAVRQVACVDARGHAAAHTGKNCIRAAGHHVGEGYSVQANMMENERVVPAMAKAFEGARGPLAERLLAALEAAQQEGGDIRGQQSAALLVVRASASGKVWEDRLVDLRVEAVVSSEGRFLCVPSEDELRQVWSGIAGHPAEEPAPVPLAERWRDWVEQWIGVALAPGEELEVPVENSSARASIRCTGRDARSTRLEYRLVRADPPGEEVRCEHERGVEAELLTAGLRPRAVRSWSRWTWRRGETIVRTPDRESLLEFDWEEPLAQPLDPALASAEPPDAFLDWAILRWQRWTLGELEQDQRWWRATWPGLPALRRAELLAAFREQRTDLGSGRPTRAWWLETRAALGRLWLGEDALARPALPVRTLVKNGPPQQAVDVLFVGDGYTAEELYTSGEYWDDVYRPWPRCLMHDHDAPFCPVCCEAVARAIYTACGLEFDDAAYHRAHPLDPWLR